MSPVLRLGRTSGVVSAIVLVVSAAAGARAGTALPLGVGLGVGGTVDRGAVRLLRRSHVGAATRVAA